MHRKILEHENGTLECSRSPDGHQFAGQLSGVGVEEALQTNETVDIFQEESLVCTVESRAKKTHDMPSKPVESNFEARTITTYL